MNNGLCDVKGCLSLPLLGWRPLTERIGRKVCVQHWRRHKDEKDSFDLFDEFGFRRSPHARKSKPVLKPVSNCGRELLPIHRLCDVCAKERERQRKKRAYHEQKNQQQPIEQDNILLCRQCGHQREAGRTVCSKCSQRRSNQSNRERQRRYYRKSVSRW